MTKTTISLIGAALAIVLPVLAGNGGYADESQDCAIEAIGKLGGRVVNYDEKKKDDPCKTVVFVNSNLTDIDLLRLNWALKKINPKKLDLSYTKVKGEGFCALSELSQLTDLDLSNTLVYDRGLEELGRLGCLSKVKLNNTYLAFTGLSKFVEDFRCRELSLYLSGATVVDDEVIPCATAIDCGLEKVCAKRLLQTLSALEKLKSLHLSGAGRISGDLKKLKKFKGLEYIDLSDNELTDPDLKQLIAWLPNTLTGISLSGNKELTNIRLHDLEKLTKLTTLRLANTGHPKDGGVGVTNEGLQSLLSNIGPLEVLDVSSTNFIMNDKVLLEWSFVCFLGPVKEKLKSLKKLNVSGTGVSDIELAAIGKLANLQELYISGTMVTDKGLAKLKDLKNLAILGYETPVTGAGVTRLEALRQNLPPLRGVPVIPLRGVNAPITRLTLPDGG